MASSSSSRPIILHDYLPDPRGFLAGVLSGLTKLSVGHPFDTIKLRVQCTPPGVYKGPIDCLLKTIKEEGPRALYKGASPPAFGWALSDAILMGSLDRYRTWLAQWECPDRSKPLSLSSHAIAGSLAGWTVCTVITPIETIKAKLQMQTSDPRTKLYTGPIDCGKKMIKHGGLKTLYHALPATLLFRTWFCIMFSSYQYINNYFEKIIINNNNNDNNFNRNNWRNNNGFDISNYYKPLAQFLAGGISAELFWICALPFDIVKNRMMCDSFIKPKYPNWISAARAVWAEGGFKGFYRGLTPCVLRAFPTNAAALVVWEATMKVMKT